MLDNETIEKLYVDYVSECSLNLQRVLQEDIQQLLNKLTESTDETDQQAHHFGNSLQAYGNSLKQNLNESKLGALINNMLGDTVKMRGSMQNLQSELTASKEQVKQLHQELQRAREEALIDPLTGIFNRRGFDNRINQIFTDAYALEKGFCLLMVDIDHFKRSMTPMGTCSAIKSSAQFPKRSNQKFADRMPLLALVAKSSLYYWPKPISPGPRL